jgi:hypothetical protein
MEREITVKIKLENLKPMYDEDGRVIDKAVFETLLFEKLHELLSEYVYDGLESDFISSDFGVDEAENFQFYGDVKLEVK